MRVDGSAEGNVMLVLKRRVGENVHLGPDITVTVLEMKGGQVRLGFEAPQTVHIVRGELVERKQARDKP